MSRWESSVPCLWCEFSTSVSATDHHDLLREDELVAFRALLPRLDPPEPDCGLLAVVPGLVDDDLRGVAFWALAPDRLDDAPEVDFFAGALDAVLLDCLPFPPDLPSPDEPRADSWSEP